MLLNSLLVILGSSASGSSRKDKGKSGSPAGSGSDSDNASLASARRVTLEPSPRNISNVPQDLSGSRQSFKMAMGNPCEFFVDVMWSVMWPLYSHQISYTSLHDSFFYTLFWFWLQYDYNTWSIQLVCTRQPETLCNDVWALWYKSVLYIRIIL